jgi:hypothetical protein
LDHGPAVAALLLGLGRLADRHGERDQAKALLSDSLARFAAHGDRSGRASALLALGLAAVGRGDSAGAAMCLTESLRLRVALGEPLGEIECLEALALAGRPTRIRAAQLLGAAAARRVSLGAPVPLVDRADHLALIEAVREDLGATAFAAAWAVGQVMPLDVATALALTGPLDLITRPGP